uniref:PX domain-containing protein n=1 Tax=Echinostoma caproni TaxID=27848 RepID=A0A183AE39_9TREM
LTSLWKSFKTSISLCLETSLPSDRKKEKILKQLQVLHFFTLAMFTPFDFQLAVEPYLSALLKDTQLLINGDYRDPEQRVIVEELDSLTPTRTGVGKSSKKSSRLSRRRANETSNIDLSDSEVRESNTYLEKAKHKRPGALNEMETDKGLWADVELTIFGPQFPRWQRASSSSSLESGASSDTGFNGGSEYADSAASDSAPANRLVLNGNIPGIAFLPHNTTAQTLLQALRKDLVQSIWARLQLLTEELHITSAELEVPRMLLPQRVLIRLPACPFLPLSDYKFLSETAEDVVARLHYFCVPIGVKGDGDTGDSGVDSPSSSVESCLGYGGIADMDMASLGKSDSNSGSGNNNRPQIFPLNERIDASCLDTSLEKSPEGSADDEISEAELMETVHQGTGASVLRNALHFTISLSLCLHLGIWFVPKESNYPGAKKRTQLFCY